jgi:hypothetical protein
VGKKTQRVDKILELLDGLIGKSNFYELKRVTCPFVEQLVRQAILADFGTSTVYGLLGNDSAQNSTNK